jgi:hypothetical protein
VKVMISHDSKGNSEGLKSSRSTADAWVDSCIRKVTWAGIRQIKGEWARAMSRVRAHNSQTSLGSQKACMIHTRSGPALNGMATSAKGRVRAPTDNVVLWCSALEDRYFWTAAELAGEIIFGFPHGSGGLRVELSQLKKNASERATPNNSAFTTPYLLKQ